MSIFDSEEDISYNTEMAFEITHEYLTEVMKYCWIYDQNLNMDIYSRYLGGVYIQIRRYRNISQEEKPIWFVIYSKFEATKHGTIVKNVKDIYKIYKEISEAYLKIGRK